MRTKLSDYQSCCLINVFLLVDKEHALHSSKDEVDSINVKIWYDL